MDNTTNDGILVVISHSSKDKELADALIKLMRSGLRLPASQIRCTSVDGYRLPAGAHTNEQLRKEINSAQVLIGLLTSSSISSTYVLFELGARWGVGLFMIPLLAGIGAESIGGPQSDLNALSCQTDQQLIQLVEDVGRELKIAPDSASAYLSAAQEVRRLAEAMSLSLVVDRASPLSPSRDVIKFDYLPRSPVVVDWEKAYGNTVATFERESEHKDALKMVVSNGYFAMDYRTSPTLLCDRLEYKAKYSSGTMIFTQVTVTSKDKQSFKTVWIKYNVGNRPAKKTDGYPDEMTLWITGDRLENGWMSFIIDLPTVVSQSWGTEPEEWVFESLRALRLRGTVSISPIHLVRT